MTLELLQFLRDSNIHLQGHQYKLIHFIEKTSGMSLIRFIKIQNHGLNQYKIQNQIGSNNTNNSMAI